MFGCSRHKIKNKWLERFVIMDKNNNKSFINLDSNIKKIEKKIGFKISKNQKVIEYSPQTLEYLKDISKKLINNKGALLIIDYGYLEGSMKDTLIAIKKHAGDNEQTRTWNNKIERRKQNQESNNGK